MPLEPQAHLLHAGIESGAVHYAWDEADVRSTFEPGDTAVAVRARGLSHRGRIALAIAIGEWILHRFRCLASLHYEFASDYIAALWVWNIDRRYVDPFRPDDREWRGQVLGVLEQILAITNDGYDAVERNADTHLTPALMCQLARYVLAKNVAFDTWLGIVLERLEAYHPEVLDSEGFFEGGNYRGAPVPRTLFDTTRAYQPERRDDHLASFLTWAKRDGNLLLRETHELIARGWNEHYGPYVWPSR